MAHDRPMHPTHAALFALAADKTMSDADILDAIRGLRAIMAKHEAKPEAKRGVVDVNAHVETHVFGTMERRVLEYRVQAKGIVVRVTPSGGLIPDISATGPEGENLVVSGMEIEQTIDPLSRCVETSLTLVINNTLHRYGRVVVAHGEEPEITIEDPEVEPEPGGPACRLDGDRCALGAHCRNIGACTLLFERVAA